MPQPCWQSMQTSIMHLVDRCAALREPYIILHYHRVHLTARGRRIDECVNITSRSIENRHLDLHSSANLEESVYEEFVGSPLRK
nr:hypothetical protein CFP56_69107 [Quercus suber]